MSAAAESKGHFFQFDSMTENGRNGDLLRQTVLIRRNLAANLICQYILMTKET